MNIDMAKSLVEAHPGNVTLSNIETSTAISASQVAIKAFGFKSLKQVEKTSYYDIPVKAHKLAKFFVQTDKELVRGASSVKVLCYWCLRNDEKNLTFSEKMPIKDKNGKVVASLVHNLDITQYNLVDISRYLKLAERDKYIVDNNGQFHYKLHNNNHHQYHLSAREMECLFYLLRGQAVKAIAQVLQLSSRTVESYFERIKYKFHCLSKAELIEKALLQGYMNVLPQSIFSASLPLTE